MEMGEAFLLGPHHCLTRSPQWAVPWCWHHILGRHHCLIPQVALDENRRVCVVDERDENAVE